MSNAELIPAEEKAIADTELPLAKRQMTDADLIVIDSTEMYEIADVMLTDAHNFEKRVKSLFEKSVAKAKATYDEIRSLRDSIVQPAENAKLTLRRKMSQWKTAEAIRIAQAEREAERARQEEIEAAENAFMETEQKVIAGEAPIEALERAEADVAIAHVATNEPVVSAAAGRASGVAGFEIEFNDIPTFLEFLASELRKESTRFDNTLGEFKTSQLNDYAKATKGRPLPGVTFKPKINIRARS